MQEVELYHHGIKGQKWGVRRFQKLNGTLTQLGKKVRQEINSREEFASAKSNWQRPTQPTDYHKRPDRYTSVMRGEKAMTPVGMGWADSRNYKKYDAEYNAHPFTTGDGTSRNKPYNAKSYAEAGKYANEYVKNSHASNASLSPYAKAANAIGATASVIKKSVGQEISDRRQFDQLKSGYQTPSSFSRNSKDVGVYGSLYADRNKNQQQRDIMAAELAKVRAGQQNQSSRIDIETLGRIGHKPVNSRSFDDMMQEATRQHEFNKELDRRAAEKSRQYRENYYKEGLKSAQAEVNLAKSRPIGNVSINSISQTSTRYRQAATRVISAAKSKVSTYATKARTNAGKAFTNYMTKMAEASKTIDSDLWSF